MKPSESHVKEQPDPDFQAEQGNAAEASENAAGTNQIIDPLASNIIKNHIIASITLGLVPVPLFDLAALTATQMSMLRSLCAHYAVEFDDGDSKPLLMALVSGSLPVLGVVGLSSIVKLIPGVGSLAGSASLGITAGAVTYAVGQVFSLHFQAGGNLQDFDPRQARAFFKRELTAGKAFVQTMKDELKELRQPVEVPQPDEDKHVASER